MKKLSNLLTIFIVAFALYQFVPRMVSSFKHQGQTIPPTHYTVLPAVKNQKLLFPDPQTNAVVIFWATWCAPCKVEMNRLKRSVEDKKIPGSKIIAINPFETGSVVDQFITREKYPFTFIEAPEVSTQLNITATPTLLFVEKGIVTSIKTGISFIAIWQAEGLFN